MSGAMERLALTLREFARLIGEARALAVTAADGIEQARGRFQAAVGQSRNPHAVAMVEHSDLAAKRLREADKALADAVDLAGRYAAELGLAAPASTNMSSSSSPTVDIDGYPYTAPHKVDWSTLHHICHGDPDNVRSGGHLFGTGRPNKTEFPPHWDDEKIAEAVSSVAERPATTEARANGVWFATGVHDGVTVTAVVRQDGSIAAGWPHSGPGVRRNPPTTRARRR